MRDDFMGVCTKFVTDRMKAWAVSTDLKEETSLTKRKQNNIKADDII